MDWEHTICAISTPPGEAAIGVVRISGPEAIQIAQRVFRKRPKGSLESLPSHTIHYGLVVSPETQEEVDEALLTLLRKPRTYTREDMVEISCHGSPLLLTKIVGLLVRSGARQAQPGEFTKRAFLNGRIDLSQAEAVMEVIRSKTEAGLKAALDQLQGGLGREVRILQERLLMLLARIEADIDFTEQGIEVIPFEEAQKTLVESLARIRKLLKGWEEGRLLRDGVVVAIVGRPNVGKSSLLNAILEEDRAIVASTPGTTRDVLEAWVNIRGMAVKLMDTAGLRKTQEPIEQEGVRRAKEAMEKAHLVLMVMDASETLQEEDCLLMDLYKTDWMKAKKTICVLNKTDLSPKIQEDEVKRRLQNTPTIRVSAKASIGLDLLQDSMRDQVYRGRFLIGETPLLISSRHWEAVEKAHQAMERAVLAMQSGIPTELLALEIRTAIDHLGEVIGTTTTDDLLDRIFCQFCIGK